MSPFGLGKPDFKKLEAKRDVEGLIKALSNEGNPEIRKFAAEALGRIGGNGAITALVQALKDLDYNVNHSAAQALDRLYIDNLTERNALYAYHSREEKRTNTPESLAKRINEAKSGTLGANSLADRLNDDLGRPTNKSARTSNKKCGVCGNMSSSSDASRSPYSGDASPGYARGTLAVCENCGKILCGSCLVQKGWRQVAVAGKYYPVCPFCNGAMTGSI